MVLNFWTSLARVRSSRGFQKRAVTRFVWLMRQATFHFDQLVKQDAVSGTKNTLNFMLHWKVHHYPWSKLHHQCSNCFTLGVEGACASLPPPPPHTHMLPPTLIIEHDCNWVLQYQSCPMSSSDYYGNARIGNTIKLTMILIYPSSQKILTDE